MTPFRSLLPMVLLLSMLGCASTHSSANDLQVTNKTDVFEFRAGSVDNLTMVQSYPWWNPDKEAVLRQSSEVRDGAARVEVRDSNDHVVLSKDLREKGTFPTLAGTPGMWTVKVVLNRAVGTLLFEMEGR